MEARQINAPVLCENKYKLGAARRLAPAINILKIVAFDREP
jgi:hypothetical protein